MTRLRSTTRPRPGESGETPVAHAGFTTGELADRLGATLVGPRDLHVVRVDALDQGDARTITFIREQKFAERWGASHAAAAVVTSGLEVPGHDASRRALLLVDDADLALIRVLELFAPPSPEPEPGVHPSATVHAAADIAPSASIGPQCVVEAGATIGEGVVLLAGAYVGRDAVVGDGTCLHPGAVVEERCVVGKRCILHAGAIVGADGFGYRPRPDAPGLVKIPHLGDVRLGDEVEIGANSCVDRAKFGSTRIGDGTKIDNLVQVGHNCDIGRFCVICGQAGISGSVRMGDGVQVGGAAGIKDNITIGAGAKITAGAGVMNDVPAGEVWLGSPAGPQREQAANYAALRRLGEIAREVKRLGRNADASRNGEFDDHE
ncbi:MAG: UDP-3-O-(3-hydroxymyristoyl)glucosamine N-acyltransferase [Phycisphaeraceae bacterium]|nr:UDP-3-O-(3-hydroxymyristoyl)glucosamine N-acyltransferase [Phycisphaeraceae bacterium]